MHQSDALDDVAPFWKLANLIWPTIRKLVIGIRRIFRINLILMPNKMVNFRFGSVFEGSDVPFGVGRQSIFGRRERQSASV